MLLCVVTFLNSRRALTTYQLTSLSNGVQNLQKLFYLTTFNSYVIRETSDKKSPVILHTVHDLTSPSSRSHKPSLQFPVVRSASSLWSSTCVRLNHPNRIIMNLMLTMSGPNGSRCRTRTTWRLLETYSKHVSYINHRTTTFKLRLKLNLYHSFTHFPRNT